MLRMRCRTLLFGVVVGVGVCAGCQRTARPGSQIAEDGGGMGAPEGSTRYGSGQPVSSEVEILYSISSLRPSTNFTLHVLPSGTAELDLWAPLSSDRADLLGRFRVPTATYSELVRYVRDHGLIDRSGGPIATAEGSGTIRLSVGGRRTAFGLADADRDLKGLRAMLDAIATQVAQNPLAAVRLAASVENAAGSPRVRAVLSHVGTEPLGILWRDAASTAVRAWVSYVDARGLEVSRVAYALPKSDRSADSVALPVGVDSFGPGRSVTLQFPPLSPPPRAEQIQVHVSASIPLGPVARTNIEWVALVPVP